MRFSDSIEFLPGGGVVSPLGFSAGAARAGIKTEGDDIALIVSEAPAVAAAVFTRSAVKAAPVLVCAEHAEHPTARAIVANSGNANCCTGAQGVADARRMCELAATKIHCDTREVLVCSTGIIGQELPMDGIGPAIDNLVLRTQADADVFVPEAVNRAVARAVMTTDTRPKFCAARATIGGRAVTIGGQAKGVGMIGPNMGPITGINHGIGTEHRSDAVARLGTEGANGADQAPHATMLAFLTTDAEIDKSLLPEALETAVAVSFNSVTVDGDTSTNDSCLLLANGASGARIRGAEYFDFCSLLEEVCAWLARMIAADGEGATKLITIQVRGAATPSDAKQIALTVANSPLVKTAIFGRDPNWGRIAMAAGRAGIAFDSSRLSISLGEVEVLRDGEPTGYDLSAAEAAMEGEELTIHIALGEGRARWTAWTCDFSYNYVKINAEYHT